MVFALSAGLGGALMLARARGAADTVAAVSAACGLGACALAFLRERGPKSGRSRIYFAWLGLALFVMGTAVLLRSPAPALLWSTLAVLAAAIGRRHEPAILQAQTAVLAGGAALASGLLAISVLAWTAGDAYIRPATFASLVALAAVTGAAILLLLSRPAAGPIPVFVAAFLSALGLGALAVLLVRQPAEALLPASLAPLRTVVVSLSAYALARLWRRTGRPELRTLAYVALVAGGVKLLVEDVPSGTPFTLFVAFVFYGGALLLIPRAMRTTAPASSG
jgi:hypothetical protein